MKGLVVFDFDGVLIDSTKAIREIFKDLYKDRSLAPLSEEEFQDLYEVGVWRGHQNHLQEQHNIERFVEDFKTLFAKEVQEIRFFEGIKDCILSMNTRFTLAIVSANHAESIIEMLRTEGIASSFADILGAEVPGSKRDKIVSLIKKHSAKPAQTYFVTDTAGDIREVEGLEVHPIGVSWGVHGLNRLEAAYPKAVLNSPSELSNYFS